MGADLAMASGAALAAWDRAADLSIEGQARLARSSSRRRPSPTRSASRQEARLRRTEWAQPAIGRGGARPAEPARAPRGCARRASAGHSFGEVAALHAAGVLDAPAFLARRPPARRADGRGRASARGDDGGAGHAPRRCARCSRRHPDVVVANHNAPDQVVLSGPTDAVERVEARCGPRGCRRGGCRWRRPSTRRSWRMPPAPFVAFLAAVPFAPAAVPVFSNAEAAPYPEDAGRDAPAARGAARPAGALRRAGRGDVRGAARGPSSRSARGRCSPGSSGRSSTAARTARSISTRGARMPPRLSPGPRAALRGRARDGPGAALGIVPAAAGSAGARAGPPPPSTSAGRTTASRIPPPEGAAALPPPNAELAVPGRGESAGGSRAAGRRRVPGSRRIATCSTRPPRRTRPSRRRRPGRTSRSCSRWNAPAPRWRRPRGCPRRISVSVRTGADRAIRATHRSRAGCGVLTLRTSSGSPRSAAGDLPSATPLRPARAAVAELRVPAAPTAGLLATLLAVVAEKTGYPADMLRPEMALEADLGIDSVKRVEILAALEERLPDLAQTRVGGPDGDAYARRHRRASGRRRVRGRYDRGGAGRGAGCRRAPVAGWPCGAARIPRGSRARSAAPRGRRREDRLPGRAADAWRWDSRPTWASTRSSGSRSSRRWRSDSPVMRRSIPRR